MRTLSYFCRAILLLSTISAASAQGQVEEPPLKVKLRFYAWDSGPIYTNFDPENAPDSPGNSNTTFYMFSEGESEKIEIRSGRSSDAFTYVGTNPIYFSSQPITAETPREQLQALPISPAKKELLLVAVQMPREPTGLKFFPIDVSPSGFPQGSLKVVNFSTDKVAARISVNEISLDPLKSVVLEVDEELGKGAPIQIAAPRGGKMRLVYSSSLSVSEDERSALIIYPKGRAWRRIFISDL